MGYDKGECLICYYGEFVGGEIIKNYNICKKCFLKHCPDGLHGHACYGDIVTIIESIKCDFCDKIDTCLYQVDICDKCLILLNPTGKKIISDKSTDDICSDDDDDDLYELFMK